VKLSALEVMILNLAMVTYPIAATWKLTYRLRPQGLRRHTQQWKIENAREQECEQVNIP
jgi:hypothetical protein